MDKSKDKSQLEEAKVRDHQDLTETDLSTLEALRGRWQAEEREMRADLAELADRDLDGLVRYRIPNSIIVHEWVFWHSLLEVVNHGTQHRSEAAMILTSYGQSPGEVDLSDFLNEYFD